MTHMAYTLAITKMKKTLKQKELNFRQKSQLQFDLANIIFNSFLVN